MGPVGSDPVKRCNKYIQFTRKKPIIRRLFIMIKSCNIVIYYRLVIYSNIKDVLLGKRQWIVKRRCWRLSWKVIWRTSWKTRQLTVELKVVQKWVELGRVPSFMLILRRVGSGHFTCGSGGSGRENLTHAQLWFINFYFVLCSVQFSLYSIHVVCDRWCPLGRNIKITEVKIIALEFCIMRWGNFLAMEREFDSEWEWKWCIWIYRCFAAEWVTL